MKKADKIVIAIISLLIILIFAMPTSDLTRYLASKLGEFIAYAIFVSILFVICLLASKKKTIDTLNNEEVGKINRKQKTIFIVAIILNLCAIFMPFIMSNRSPLYPPPSKERIITNVIFLMLISSLWFFFNRTKE